MAHGGTTIPHSDTTLLVGSSSCSAPNEEEEEQQQQQPPSSADVIVEEVGRLGIGGGTTTTCSSSDKGGSFEMINDDDGAQVTCFTEVLDDVTFHFQIIRLHKQIYAWIGCNSGKFGHLYAAASTRLRNTVSVTNILGGASDNTGSGIARRLVLKTGLNVILACNIPKNSPMLEADAEKKLVQKLINLGYTRPKSNGSSSQYKTEVGML